MNFTNLGATTFFPLVPPVLQDIYRHWVDKVEKPYIFSALKFGTPVPVSATRNCTLPLASMVLRNFYCPLLIIKESLFMPLFDNQSVYAR